MSATNPENASDFEAPLTRREMREREATVAHVTVEDVEPEEAPPTPVSDSGLPSLFGDDKKEEVKEVPIVAAAYAREAPAAKYLDEGQPRIVLSPAPETVYRHPQQAQQNQAKPQPQHYAPSAQNRKESWTKGAIIKVVAFSLLYAGLSLAMFAVPMVMLVAEAATTAP